MSTNCLFALPWDKLIFSPLLIWFSEESRALQNWPQLTLHTWKPPNFTTLPEKGLEKCTYVWSPAWYLGRKWAALRALTLSPQQKPPSDADHIRKSNSEKTPAVFPLLPTKPTLITNSTICLLSWKVGYFLIFCYFLLGHQEWLILPKCHKLEQILQQDENLTHNWTKRYLRFISSLVPWPKVNHSDFP